MPLDDLLHEARKSDPSLSKDDFLKAIEHLTELGLMEVSPLSNEQ